MTSQLAPLFAAMAARSVVSRGDTARLERVMARARRGERVTVGTIGGSITQGAQASEPEKRYASRLAAWWRERFPLAPIEFVNAGIGATGSDIGAHRVGRDLLARAPDVVVAEYAVNDGNSRLYAETLEGLTRQVLRSPAQPALLLLFMTRENRGNAQEWHAQVGAHYALPMISFHDAVWPELDAGTLAWSDIEADNVHPNDAGHSLAAALVTAFWDDVLASLPPDEALPMVADVPAPLFSKAFERAVLLDARDIAPIENSGWEVGTYQGRFGPGWSADLPGSVLEFEVEGGAISVAFHRIQAEMGIVTAQIDDGPPLRLDAWYELTWGGYAHCVRLASGLSRGRHRLRLEVSGETNPHSGGHRFELMALLCADLAFPPD